MGPTFGVFWMVLLTWDARNAICLALIGYFSQKRGLISDHYGFCNFFTILVPNIFENISKTVAFLGKVIKIYFVDNLSRFQENIETCKSVANFQSCI